MNIFLIPCVLFDFQFIKITFKQLDLYGFPCMYDFLALYDADSGEPLGMFCGNIMPTPRVLISKATRMKVEFITDALNTRKGFEIDYDFIAPLPQPGQYLKYLHRPFI